MDELRTNVILLKHLDQEIDDSIIAGAGEAGGHNLTIIFAQEAAARLTPLTRIYLNWKHLDIPNLRGFDAFTPQDPIELACGEFYPVWSIKWPTAMKQEGTVEASIVLLDEVSKDESLHFTIEVLSDLHGSDDLMDEDNYSLFEQALLDMNKTIQETQELLESTKELFSTIEELQAELESKLQEITEEQEKLQQEQTELRQEWEDFLKEHEKYDDRVKKLEEQMYIWFAYHGLAYYPRIDVSHIAAPGIPEYKDHLAGVI